MNSSVDEDPARAGARPQPRPVEVPPVNGVLIALTNVPDEECAREIADALVRERFAACVNILAGCTSIYRWQGEVETADEIPLLIKTTTDRFAALEARLTELHPYDVPELIAWRPDAVIPAYASWVIVETRRRRAPG
ncbi:MAG: hypothetical protein RIS35_1481 [Pseudomonadota bacterium]|jgi:periplasmic divalent cation tolerance protein